eukprot:scaffold252608_cov34-Prasinocladus_malaysianus.AAC.1
MNGHRLGIILSGPTCVRVGCGGHAKSLESRLQVGCDLLSRAHPHERQRLEVRMEDSVFTCKQTQSSRAQLNLQNSRNSTLTIWSDVTAKSGRLLAILVNFRPGWERLAWQHQGNEAFPKLYWTGLPSQMLPSRTADAVVDVGPVVPEAVHDGQARQVGPTRLAQLRGFPADRLHLSGSR